MEKKKNALTRRDFLKGFGSGALGAAVAPKLLTQEAESLQIKEEEIPFYTKKRVTMTVNEKKISMTVEPQETLLDVLRDRLGLTGAKKMCDRGECGGCTVLLNGKPVYSCMYLALRADGANITTVEGLASKDKLDPVQQAFIDKDAYQCGFCTSGFVMSSVAFLKESKNPHLEDIKKALSGNLCRCVNYYKIYQAVEEAAKLMRRP
jgi:xanthine dehydrogenase YagT iron-sulfur-binding subunit